jgi:signal transduction histidine kinase
MSVILPVRVNSGENPEGFFKISFHDNGIGFENYKAEKMFDIFQRLHSRTAVPGTGIGLAICKKVIQNHSGFIAGSGNPGEGAVFTIYLPAGNKSTEPDGNKPTDTNKPSDTNKPTDSKPSTDIGISTGGPAQ